jgi:hypothetical protein
MLKVTQPGVEKAGVYREQVPGLVLAASLGAAIRGMWWTGSRLFVVAGTQFVEVRSDYTTTIRGTLLSADGPVDMAQGLFSLVVVDGERGYVLTLGTNAFSEITDEDFLGADRVGFLDGKFIFHEPGTQVWYWSEGIDTATQYDALDFASAESQPDNLVSLIVDHREVWLFGEYTTEVYFPNPGTDQVYARNNGAAIETGCAAAHTPQRIDNTIYWLGKDKTGQGMVWAAGGSNGYTPQRISSQELEDVLATVEDLSAAYAWTYQDAGQWFYVLQVPGLTSTWVFDSAIRKWHERCELNDGVLTRWRGDAHAFAFGRHLVGGDDGKLYELDPYVFTFNGDPIPRIWTTTHQAAPTGNRVFFDSVRLDITAGETDSGEMPSVEMRYSNDGGETWTDWRARSTGVLGKYSVRPRWDRLGMGRDRVFEFRCTDNAKVSIIGMHVQASEGLS